MALTIKAPVAGWVSPLDEVPDPVFSGRILGDGVAIDPTGNVLAAPCDGIVIALAHHAATVRAENGVEILAHIGLETVALKGEGFKMIAKEGQAVLAGDPLLSFDLDVLASLAKSLISPVIIANGEAFVVEHRNVNKELAAGDVLMEIVSVAGTAQKADDTTNTVTRKIKVASEHGLHARPAAVFASAAKAHPGEVMLSCRGRTANAKSAVAVMALGIGHAETVMLAASGVGAEEAIEKLAKILDVSHCEVIQAQQQSVSGAERSASLLYGVCAAPGRAVGTAVQLGSSEIPIVEDGAGIAVETKALQSALATVQAHIETVVARSAGPKRDILLAHRELLQDPELLASALRCIERGKSAAYAWRVAVQSYVELFRNLNDSRLRERAADLKDLERQVLTELLPTIFEPKLVLPSSAILIAEEFLPSDLIGLDRDAIAGLISAGGGPTSHVAILAAGVNLPALVGVGADVLEIANGTQLLLDAEAGFVDCAPDPEVLAMVNAEAERTAVRHLRERADAAGLCFTADGTRVEVFANLGKGTQEAADALSHGAEGCGLLRTEFLFMDRDGAPDEAEQRTAYQAIADALGGRSFILRTFDIGADKPVPYLPFSHEDNPQLGLRGVRAGLFWSDLLRTQLRAALQVTPCGTCKILLPMITELEEVRAICSLIQEACQDLDVPKPQLGVMIETPASAVLADQFIREVDFLSIGTNDLSQYVLAIDRTHGQLSKRLDGLHPAVLRLIARAADAASGAHKIAAVCGGLAADPLAAPILLGLGIKELSVPAPAIPHLKAAIRNLRIGNCRALAREALNQESAVAVRALVRRNKEDAR